MEENFQRLIGFESFFPTLENETNYLFPTHSILAKCVNVARKRYNLILFYMLLEKLKLLIKLVDIERTDALASHSICNHSKRP